MPDGMDAHDVVDQAVGLLPSRSLSHMTLLGTGQQLTPTQRL